MWSQTWTADVSDDCGNPATQFSVTYHWKVDVTPPTTVCPEERDIGCNPEEGDWAPGTVVWDDNCGVESQGVTPGTPVASADGCTYEVTHTHWAEDFCGNRAECEEVITWGIDVVGNCETAFARLDDEWSQDEEGALCFLDIPDSRKPGHSLFSRWGWTNYFPEPDDYSMKLYAGAGQCDISKGTYVGDVTVSWDGLLVTVEYIPNPGIYLSQVHLYIGYDSIPSMMVGNRKKYTVAPGQYTFKDEDAIVNNKAEFVIDLTKEDPFWIIAHAVTCTRTCTCDEDFFENPLYDNTLLSGVPVVTSREKNPSASSGIYGETDVKDNLPIFGSPVGEVDYKVYPNPFRDEVFFDITPLVNTKLKLVVISSTGQLVEELFDGEVQEGNEYRFVFNSNSYPDAMFLFRIITDHNDASGQLIKAR
jgi:hypothetical protein